MRAVLEDARIAPEALRYIETFHADVVAEVQAAVAKDNVVVVGMALNRYVGKARQALREAGIAFTYLEYGGYFSHWRKRVALKLWSGWPTLPIVFVKGTLIGGEAAVRAALADGSLQQRLLGK